MNSTTQNPQFTKSLNFLMAFICLVMLNYSSHAQGWQWAKSGGGISADGGNKICTDVQGNVYVGGTYSSLSISIGTITLPNAGLSDVFVAKFDPNGNVLWAQRIAGTGFESIGGICTSTTGDVFVTGYFSSPTMTVSPYTVGNATTTGTYDIFIAHFNSFGVTQWIQPWGSAGDERATGCAYSNGLYVTGHYFSPSFTIGSNTLTNTSASGKSDVFLAKWALSGAILFAKTTGASTSQDLAYALTIDGNGNPCFGGVFGPQMITGTTTIGSTMLTSVGGQEIYFAKYDASGNPLWAKAIGGAGSGDFFSDIKSDPSNNFLVAGYYQGGNLVVGTTTLTNINSSYDIFTAKYDNNGNPLWANAMAGTDADYGYGITTDANSNVYITGGFASTTITAGSKTLTNTNATSLTDIYVVKYDPAGTVQWAVNPTGASNEQGASIASDAVGNIYSTGVFNIAGPTAFGTTTLNSAGGSDYFLAKIGCLTPTISGLSNVCSGTSATLTATGATSYTWNTGATSSSIVITPTANATYSLVAATGSCQANSTNNFTVTYLPASVNAGSDFSLSCNLQSIINASSNPSSPTNVQWSPSTGLSNATVLTPTVMAPVTPMQYIVTCTLTNGCVKKDTVIVSPFVTTPSICIVTADSANVNNKIYWDKTSYPSLDSMIIYREVSANVYRQIGAVSRNALSLFADTARSIGPSNGDPNISTYRYKIQIRDTCGVYSTKSLWHNTVFFTRTGSTFFWINNYMIEGNINPVLTYSLMVCPNNTISTTYTLVGTTTGSQNQLNDPNYNAYQNTADWRVYADMGYACIPSFVTVKQKITPLTSGQSVTKSSSNIQNNRPKVGIKENDLKAKAKVYPNPTNGKLNIEFETINEETTLSISNVLGQEIHNEKIQGNKIMDVSNFPKGIYTLTINRKEGKAVYKIVVE